MVENTKNSSKFVNFHALPKFSKKRDFEVRALEGGRGGFFLEKGSDQGRFRVKNQINYWEFFFHFFDPKKRTKFGSFFYTNTAH